MDMLSPGGLNTLHYAKDQVELFDDFLWYLSPHLWTSLVTDTNSAVAIDADGVGGQITVFTGDGTDNNEAALATTNELFLFGQAVRCRVPAQVLADQHQRGQRVLRPG
jgi:hypothetical protein